MQNDRITLAPVLRIEWGKMVGNSGRPIRIYCSNPGVLEYDMAVEVLFYSKGRVIRIS